MFANPNKNKKCESVEEAIARGVHVTKCPSIPAKGQRETEKNYKKRVSAAKKIDVDAIPADLQKYLVDVIK